MHDVCELCQLPWIFHVALALLNTMELKDTEESLTTTLKAGGIMDVVCMPWACLSTCCFKWLTSASKHKPVSCASIGVYVRWRFFPGVAKLLGINGATSGEAITWAMSRASRWVHA